MTPSAAGSNGITYNVIFTATPAYLIWVSVSPEWGE